MVVLFEGGVAGGAGEKSTICNLVKMMIIMDVAKDYFTCFTHFIICHLGSKRIAVS